MSTNDGLTPSQDGDQDSILGAEIRELISDAEVHHLHELAALYRFFRSHPDASGGILRLKALRGGYSEEDIERVWWAICLAIVTEPEQENLHRDAWRN